MLRFYFKPNLSAGTLAIPLEEFFEVARVTIEVANMLRQQ